MKILIINMVMIKSDIAALLKFLKPDFILNSAGNIIKIESITDLKKADNPLLQYI
jgi:hypothetical protein